MYAQWILNLPRLVLVLAFVSQVQPPSCSNQPKGHLRLEARFMKYLVVAVVAR